MTILEYNMDEPPYKRLKKNSIDETPDEDLHHSLNTSRFLEADRFVSYNEAETFFKELSKWIADGDLQERVQTLLKNDIGTILEHHSLRKYFKHNLKDYFIFVSNIIQNINDLELLFPKGRDIFFSKTLILEKDFHKYFLDIMLPLFVELLHKNNDSSLYNSSCEIIKKCLMNKKSIEFDNYFNDVLGLSEKKSKEKYIIPKDIIKAITLSYKLKTPEASSTYKIIFQSFSNCTNEFSLIYKFCVLLIQTLGFDLQKDFEICKISKLASDRTLNKSLSILSDVLEVVARCKVELSCSVKICFSEFIENIVNSVIALNRQPDAISYKILINCIEIHPLLAENNLKNLLVYSMLNNNIENRESYTDFLLKIFEVYSKLHRIQNILSKMLSILATSTNNNLSMGSYYTFRGVEDCHEQSEKCSDVEMIVPEKAMDYLTDSITQMASWQVMNIFKTLLYHLDVTTTSFIDQNSGRQNNFLEFLCRLLSWFLNSIRMAENSITSTVKDKFHTAMITLKDIMGKLGSALLKKEHNRDIVGAFLKLSLDWTEMIMTFHYYNEGDNEELIRQVKKGNFLNSCLSNEQWTLLFQRVNNFGESNCKQTMAQLSIQKLRYMQLFDIVIDENLEREIIEHFSCHLEDNYEFIISNKFINEVLMKKISSDVIFTIAEKMPQILKNKIDEFSGIRNSEILSKAFTHTCFMKISKLLNPSSEDLLMKILAVTEREKFLDESLITDSWIAEVKNIYETNLWKSSTCTKISSSEKFKKYLTWLTRLPFSYFSWRIQYLVLLHLFSLHKHLWCDSYNESKELIEKLILGLLQTMKIDVISLFEPVSLVQNITQNFGEQCNFLCSLFENAMKYEVSLRSFIPCISYLLEHIDEGDNMHFSLLILNDLHRLRKSKNSQGFKEFYSKSKEIILEKHNDIILSRGVESKLIESYTWCLKDYLVKEESKKTGKITQILDRYLDHALSDESEIIARGSTLFFSLVLLNKQSLKVSPDLPWRIWKYIKSKEVPTDELESTQLLGLVFEHVPNEEFRNLTNDLLDMMEKPINKKDFPQLLKHLNVLSTILTSSFNSNKITIWQEVLDVLLFKLNELKGVIDEPTFSAILTFEVVIIRHNLLVLSPTKVGIFLMSPLLLIQRGYDDFYSVFCKSVDYLGVLLKHRTVYIVDRIPPFLRVFRILLAELCKKCNIKIAQSTHEIDRLADCAHHLEKIVRQIIVHKKDIARISPHLIADILNKYEEATLYPKVKVHLNNCIYSLISICDHHAVSYLLRVLSSASTEMFKIMFNNYKKFYRFTGKV